MNKLKLRMQLEQFFLEDIGERDVTSSNIFENGQKGQMILIAKEEGVFCGNDVILAGFQMMDPEVEIELLLRDGDSIHKGQKLAVINGQVEALLKAERVVLNLLQRMSGISSITSKAIQTLNSEHTRICDTRKTTPGLRMLEKYAVRTGGGYNHRYGLYDAAMIKDNHIAFAGSIKKAVELLRTKLGHMVKIEVEIETLEQVHEAVAAKVDVIMFDNRKPEQIRDWLQHIPSHIVTEASGGIVLDNLADFRECGVDYISLGFLTHSVKALDISATVEI